VTWWIIIDNIPPAQAFASPYPYLLLAITWFLGLPAYALLRPWHRDKLIRLLGLSTIGASPFAALAIRDFPTPRDLFAAFLIMTTGWVGTAAFWAVLRLVSANDSHE
jgi:hypothetical protein